MTNLLKKSILIGLGYYTIVLINACCQCKETRRYLFSIDQIPASSISYTFEGDTNFSYTTIVKDTVDKKTFGLLISFDGQKLVYQKQLQTSIINSALACKCAEDNYTSIDTLKQLNITTLLDFDASMSAGSDVSDYFKYLEIQYEPKKIKKVSIKEHVYKSKNYYSYTPSLQALPIHLVIQPQNAEQKMQFAISAIFSNGKILKDTTAIINYY